MIRLVLISICLVLFVAQGCSAPPEKPVETIKIGMVLDTGGDRDHGFNEYSLKGAQNAAKASGIEFDYLISESTNMFERNIDKVIAEGADLIFTVGFALANATAKAAIRYPDRSFVIMDYAYFPGSGCAEDVQDCYTEKGGLPNVTSLMFAEDQPAYLAGVLAACLSKSGVIAAVAGYEIPPVVRFVEGFNKGARSINPNITFLKRYIPDFNDADTGRVVALDFISNGADVLFCPAGSTGLGGLKAAKDSGVMAIGVDVDQYLTYPDAGSALVTSVMKNVDVAAEQTVLDFAQGRLNPGIQYFDLKDNAVGLAPLHEWKNRVPQSCLDQVEAARKKILADPGISKAGIR